jgi:hypothetical protein
MIWDNNVVFGGPGAYCHYRRPPRDVSIHLTQSTFLAAPALVFLLDIPPEAAIDESGAAPAPVRVQTAQTIFHPRDFVFGFGQDFLIRASDTTALPPAEAEVLLRRLVTWQDQQNMYSDQLKDFFALAASPNRLEPTRERKTLDDWRQFWGTAQADSLQGRILYEGGDLWGRGATTPDQLAPGDFRLHRDSAGFHARDDGGNLGADVDLVGPGPACERWRQMPQYEQWLNETGQGTRHGSN